VAQLVGSDLGVHIHFAHKREVRLKILTLFNALKNIEKFPFVTSKFSCIAMCSPLKARAELPLSRRAVCAGDVAKLWAAYAGVGVGKCGPIKDVVELNADR
jgi:hypothetical protein